MIKHYTSIHDLIEDMRKAWGETGSLSIRDGTCLYGKGSNGCGCIFGALMPPAVADELDLLGFGIESALGSAREGNFSPETNHWLIESFGDLDIDTLFEIQQAHDGSMTVAGMWMRLEAIAKAAKS